MGGSPALVDDVAGATLPLQHRAAIPVIEGLAVFAGPIIEETPERFRRHRGHLVRYDLQVVPAQGIIRVRICNPGTGGVLYAGVARFPGKPRLLGYEDARNLRIVVRHDLHGLVTSVRHHQEFKVLEGLIQDGKNGPVELADPVLGGVLVFAQVGRHDDGKKGWIIYSVHIPSFLHEANPIG